VHQQHNYKFTHYATGAGISGRWTAEENYTPNLINLKITDIPASIARQIVSLLAEINEDELNQRRAAHHINR
jgi:hypothetical protein